VNVCAIIPARGGSKGVPRKNIRHCAGKPLFAWSVEAARASRFVRESGLIVVSSEDPEILTATRMLGPDIIAQPRPAELATDEAPTDPVLAYVLKNIQFRPDLVVLLQPTVPVRRPGLVDDCIQRLFDTDADCCFTGRALSYVWWREDRGSWAEEAEWHTNNPQRQRRQDLDPRSLEWEEDGSVYVCRRELLVEWAGSSKPPRRIAGRVQVLPNERTVDVDTEADFAQAEALLLAQEAIPC
jgi:CMP-N,N'-diacetyllegionaminic acid synthase